MLQGNWIQIVHNKYVCLTILLIVEGLHNFGPPQWNHQDITESLWQSLKNYLRILESLFKSLIELFVLCNIGAWSLDSDVASSWVSGPDQVFTVRSSPVSLQPPGASVSVVSDVIRPHDRHVNIERRYRRSTFSKDPKRLCKVNNKSCQEQNSVAFLQ